MDVRRRWKEKIDTEQCEHVNVYDDIKKCYEVNNECIEKDTEWYLSMVVD